jgi:hypothetical protein
MIIEPLLPPEPLKPNGGRPRVPDRAAFAGIKLAGHAQGAVDAQDPGVEIHVVPLEGEDVEGVEPIRLAVRTRLRRAGGRLIPGLGAAFRSSGP